MNDPTGADPTADRLVDAEPPTPTLVCEADLVQVDLPDDGEDPFIAALQLSGVHYTGTEISVWLRLTPTTIGQLLASLHQVLEKQQTTLGVPLTEPTVEHLDEKNDPDRTEQEQEGRIRRFLDPLGIRHLQARSPRSTVILAAAIATLMLLASVVQLVRG